jgi:thiosulfate/3-mercaptopyruvate sulfurtransferase
MKNTIVSSQWLQENLTHPELIVLDATPKNNKAGLHSNFENVQIKSARYFDLENNFSDRDGKFPNTFPTAQQFETECRNLGINGSSFIVVYDALGVYTSPRVWWMFKAMGHENIAVLDGGLPEWIEKGHPTEPKHNKTYELGNFVAQFEIEQVKDFEFVLSNIEKQEALVIDARSSDRFLGIVPEPRKGLRSGTIPNAINIPFESVLENEKFKSKDDLKALFKDKIQEKPLVFSCGSGVTACIVLLAAEMVLDHKKAIYDGSWTEWGTLFGTS